MSKSQNGKTVRLAAETIEKLGKKRVGFETPDECINRILSKSPYTNQEDDVAVEDEE